MDGVPVPGELTLDKRKRLIELITVFRLWLEAGQSSPTISPQPSSVPDPIREAVSVPRLIPSEMQFPVPRRPPSNQLRRSKKPEPEKNIASLSIVQQIDTVLQDRLLNTPLADAAFVCRNQFRAAWKFMSVCKNSRQWKMSRTRRSKSAIRAAIAEWEKKYTPGM